MNKLFIGVDVGINGAISVLDTTGKCLAYKSLPHCKVGKRTELDGKSLGLWITNEVLIPQKTKPHECFVVVEESPPFGMGTVSAYTSGYNNGRLHERLYQVFGKMPVRISAKEWQRRVYDFKLKRSDDKKAISIKQAKEKHGDLDGAFKVKKYADGISDSLHIAEYGRKIHLQSQLFTNQ